MLGCLSAAHWGLDLLVMRCVRKQTAWFWYLNLLSETRSFVKTGSGQTPTHKTRTKNVSRVFPSAGCTQLPSRGSSACVCCRMSAAQCSPHLPMQTQQQEVRKTPLLDSFGRLYICKRSVYQDRLGATIGKKLRREMRFPQEEALAVADRTRVVMKTTMEEKGQ